MDKKLILNNQSHATEQSKGDPEDLNPSELHESKLRSNVAVNLHHLSRERFQNLLLVNRAHF